jgi:hypothetical protein
MRSLVKAAVLCVAVAVGGCQFPFSPDEKFGDQHFKTAVSLIELHRVRFGEYPASLEDLRFTGEWDPIALHSVEYRRVEKGYELNLTRGWMQVPDLSYPPEFWHGLGIVRSNVRGCCSEPEGGQ